MPEKLLTVEGEGHRNSVERHPVDFSFPSIPRPEGARVSKGAHVIVVAPLVRRLGGEGGRHHGKWIRTAQSAILPRNQRVASVFEIPIQSGSDRNSCAGGKHGPAESHRSGVPVVPLK